MLSTMIAKPLPADAWVAERDGLSVGIIATEPLDPLNGVWAIERIAAAERRQGIGRALLETLEKGVFAKGGRLIVAEVTSSPGFAAVRSFLAAVGFAPVGDCPEYYKDGYSQIRFVKHLPAVIESETPNAEPTAAVGRAVTGGGLL
jgi:ribosomal protein S18 acetylase RimI-like enzyme